MPTPATPSAPAPKGDKRAVASADENVVVPHFEERLRLFWEKNSTVVTALLVAIMLAIVAKGAWDYFEAAKEKNIEQAYAAASTPAELKDFAAAHAGHTLGGVAELRLADEVYAAGKYSEAAASYEKSMDVLKADPLASRARLGLAMAQLEGGRTAEGEAALKALAADAKLDKAYRAEAAYHLASHAFASGNTADVKTYSDLLMQIDPSGPWTQRTLQLFATGPTAQNAPASSAGPTIQLPGK